MSQDKPLPFIYQFAAGAVAGVSEVRATHYSQCTREKLIMPLATDSGDVGSISLHACNCGQAHRMIGIL